MSPSSTHSIVYLSCTRGGYEILRNLVRSGYDIAEVVTLDSGRADEFDIAGYASHDSFAKDHDIPVYYPEAYDLSDEADIEHFRQMEGDLMLVTGWQRLVPESVLRTFSRGALGIHGSAYGLPAGRGRSPLNWSLVEDLDRFLLSLIKLDAGVDSGSIADTRKFDITDYDTIETLYYKVSMVATDILLETLDDILAGEFEYTPQTGEATHYPKRTPEDGRINWHEPTRVTYNLVRAVTRPYPGAFTQVDGNRVYIWEAIPFSDDIALNASPGKIVQYFPTGEDFVVATADGTLLVTDWEAEDWKPTEGVVFESSGTPSRVDYHE